MSPTLTNPAEAQARAAAEADLTLTLPGGVPMYFRRIPAAPQGFLMGERGGDRDAEPIHRVVIPRDFWLGTFPVTQAQYRAVATAWSGDTLHAEPSYFYGDNLPVEQVSWDDAEAWSSLLRRHWGHVALEAAAGVRIVLERLGLPNEAQWEYACRGRKAEGRYVWSRTEYHTGDGVARMAEAGWFGDDQGMFSTHEVGQKMANGFGLHDMLGNVLEWCEDAWDAKAYRKREDGWMARAWTLADAAVDAGPRGQFSQPDAEPGRVVRGDALDIAARRCRSASRDRRKPGIRFRDQGFRICLVCNPADQAKPAGAGWMEAASIATTLRCRHARRCDPGFQQDFIR